MANYSTLKAAVADVVKTNGTQAITGANLQTVLFSIINSVGGGGYIFKGVATPSTDAGTPDENVFYVGGAGTYANFGTSVTVPVGSICVFRYNGSWAKEQIALFAGIDDVPTQDSTNLITSGAVYPIALDVDANKNLLYGAHELSKSIDIQAHDWQVGDFIPVRVLANEKIRVKFSVGGSWTRFLILYNNNNSLRFLNTTTQSDEGVWFDFVAPVDLAYIGFYGSSSDSLGTVTLYVDYDGANDIIKREQSEINGIQGNFGYYLKDAIVGQYYGSTGAILFSSLYARTPLIYIKNASHFYFENITRINDVSFFDDGGEFISRTGVVTISPVSIPSTATYMGISLAISDSYQNGYILIDSILFSDLDNEINGIDYKLSPLTLYGSNNLFNPFTRLQHYVLDSDGVPVQNNSYDTSDYIKISPSTAYHIIARNGTANIRSYALYDEYKHLDYYYGNSTSSFTTTSSAYYLRMSIDRVHTMEDISLCTSDITEFDGYKKALSYEDYAQYEDNAPNDLMNKKKVLEAFDDEIGSIDVIKALNAVVEETDNLLNPSEIALGKFLDGYSIVTSPNYNTTGFMPVQPNTTYIFKDISWVNYGCRSWAGYSTNKVGVENYNTSAMPSSITTGANTYFIRLSYYSSLGTNVGVFPSTSTEWADYGYMVDVKINGIPTPIEDKTGKSLITKDELESAVAGGGGGNVKLIKNGVNLSIKSNDFIISAALDLYPNSLYAYNHEFNFNNYVHVPSSTTFLVTDDTAPAHIINTTIGANHGQPCSVGTINNHGLTNTSIGTAWTHSSGIVYYVTRIVNTNQVQFLSANQGTNVSPTFVALTTGTITNGTTTLTITAVTSSQLYPSSMNVEQHIMLNGEKEVTDDGEYLCKYLDIVETYDVADPISVLANLIARAGSTADPTMAGDALIKFKNIYRFMNNCNVLVISTYIPQRQMKFENFMFTQSSLPSSFRYYLPNSNPINGYDFRTPLSVTWGSSVPYLYVTTANMADPTHPVNRVVTYGSNFGFALGYCDFAGVGKNLNNFTKTTFEIRNNTGKIYPHGVDSAQIGDTLNANQVYSSVMYRALIDNSTATGNRMSMYHFTADNAEYVYVDYSGSMTDSIQVSDDLNGKAISVVESVNTTLLSDIYNDGFFVKADYVSGETCFIVLKIQ